MSRTRKVHVKSFGCQMNVYDSHRMADTLAPAGFAETAQVGDADLVILNTCNIREKAVDKLYSEIGRMRELKDAAAAQGRRMLIAVAGCVAQAEGQEIIRRAGAVDLVVGSQNYHRLPDADRARAGRRAIVDTEFPAKTNSTRSPRRARSDPQARHFRLRHRAGRLRQVLHVLRRALYARRGSLAPGRENRRRSRAARRRRRARGDADRAERECLSRAEAQTAGPATLGKLLRRLAEVPGILRLRYTTSHPTRHGRRPDRRARRSAGADALRASAGAVRLRPHAGGDEPPAHAQGLSRRDRAPARKRAPISRFTSDFIVGFPGETEEDFRDTLSLVEEVGYASAYTFMYSPRPGTPAADMADQIGDAEKSERLQRLQALITRLLAGLQCAIRRPHRRGAAGKTGQVAWATGRPHPISADGAGHGAA